jgi:hypothetical protein
MTPGYENQSLSGIFASSDHDWALPHAIAEYPFGAFLHFLTTRDLRPLRKRR